MLTSSKGEPAFDNELFGMLLRRTRQKAGYATAEDFCKDLSIWGGVEISKDKLYRIEAGKQPMTIDILVAVSVLLGRGKGYTKTSEALAAMAIDMCSCSYFSDLLQTSAESPLELSPAFDGEKYNHKREKVDIPF